MTRPRRCQGCGANHAGAGCLDAPPRELDVSLLPGGGVSIGYDVSRLDAAEEAFFSRQLELQHGDVMDARVPSKSANNLVGHFHKREPAMHWPLKPRAIRALADAYAHRWVRVESRVTFHGNRHNRRRWMRAFAPIAQVAGDAMIEGRRVDAVTCLLEMLPLEHALDLTADARADAVRIYTTAAEVERDFGYRSAEYVSARSTFDLQVVGGSSFRPGDRVRMSSTGAVLANPDDPAVAPDYVVQSVDANTIRVSSFAGGYSLRDTYAYPTADAAQTLELARRLYPTATPPVPDEDAEPGVYKGHDEEQQDPHR